MGFDEIIALENIKKEEMSKMDKIREQRQICAVIICGVIYDGLKLTQAEHVFVDRIKRSMKPISEHALSALKKIEERRWR